MRALTLILIFGFALFVVILGIDLGINNNDPIIVRLRLLTVWDSETYPLYVLLLLSGLIGAILSAVFFIFDVVSLEAKVIRLKRQLQQAERALSKLKDGDPKIGSTLSFAAEEPADHEFSKVTS